VATAGERGDASGARERASQIEVEVLHLVQMVVFMQAELFLVTGMVLSVAIKKFLVEEI
jgi:hypothetical protein